MFQEILAVHLRVDHTHNVETSTDLHRVLVYQHILVHLQIVDQNVLLILNAQATKHVSLKNVEILVQALVESVPIVML